MARFYANENFPFPVVVELRRLKHDVLTIQETGEAGRSAPDEEVLRFAAAESRALLTLNRRHFVRLHSARARHAGIVACAFDSDFGGLARRIHDTVKAVPQLAGRLLRINRVSQR